jgi:ubiquinone/menaquinone biosynthesis C-methylase UbiE
MSDGCVESTEPGAETHLPDNMPAGEEPVTDERESRSRFYDGRPYAAALDRLLGRLHQLVADNVEPSHRLLDVGCGTGDLVWRLAPKAEEVVGIDLSPAMVEFAQDTLSQRSVPHVSFVLGDVTKALAELPDDHFDVATMTLVLHEMPEEARGPVLREVTRLARRVLCVDFRAPMPWNVAGVRNRFLEVAAGREHYRAYRAFQRMGGVPGAAREAGLVYELLRPVDARTMEMGFIRRAP